MTFYPFDDGAPYPRDQWYIAAWSTELGPTPLGRTILGEPVVMYRAADGDPVALSGVCPHRWMPLAKGQVVDDSLVCPYHGMRFDRLGRCHSAPAQERAPPSCRLNRYPLIERAPCLWIWPGAPELADPAAIPDGRLVGLGAADWRQDLAIAIPVKARAQLLLENLFNESHIPQVHALSLPAPVQQNFQSEARVEESIDRFAVIRTRRVAPTDDSMRTAFPKVGPFFVSELYTELFGVSLVNSVGSHTFDASPEGEKGVCVGRMNFIHGITPETPNTTHYFTAITRDFSRADDAISAALCEHNARVAQEDVSTLEAIEPYLCSHADARREVNLASDVMAVRVRNRIRELIRAEAAPRTTV